VINEFDGKVGEDSLVFILRREVEMKKARRVRRTEGPVLEREGGSVKCGKRSLLHGWTGERGCS